jgi:calcineurin-like phosphoesterase family protein
MATFFTSDTHYGDHRVLNLYKRPFASSAEMDEALVARWNKQVGEGDEIWHLGDFARTPRHAQAILPRLHGRKFLVLGNLDGGAEATHGWDRITPYAELRLEGVDLVLCHYPFRSWNGMHRGSVNLHGHSHGRLKPLPRQVDVGVDVHGLRPVTLTELLQAGASGPGRAARQKRAVRLPESA